MTAGGAASRGRSGASIIASIMSSEPTPISTLQPLSPPALDRVVQTCLAKDPDERWQTAHDVRLQLEWIRDAGSQAGVPRVKGQRRRTRESIVWASAALLLLGIATMSVIRILQPSSQPQPRIMFAVELPPGYKMTVGAMALSPNGSLIAYSVIDAKGKQSVWVRPLDSLSPQQLEGSESVQDIYAFTWTTDGKAVIAQVNGKLVRFSAT